MQPSMSNLKRKRGADELGECSSKAIAERGTSLHPSIGTHEVFISHRGIDMKRKFASHLHTALDRLGIKAFLDMKELPEGDDVRPSMLEAARAAIIGVPIFTRIFAESRWCLDELVEMMKSSSTTKRSKVIPVFYDVKSEDLRRDDGPFAKAIIAHREEGKRDEETITRWESALREASWLEGFRLETYNQCEADLIKHLSDKVVEEVHNRVPVVTGPNAVGLQERVSDVVRLLSLENQQHIYFVLLWGMGGIGKTTLARDIYHKYRNQFVAASFVERPEDKERWKNKKSIQDCLRKDLLHHEKVNRDDIARGKAILQNGLRDKKVLIVLDDIESFASIEDVIDPTLLHPGSRILVTSRDKGLFPSENHFTDVFRGKLYEVPPLDHHASLRLLCCHAFKKPAPESGFEELAMAVTEACKGLPLSLELIGSHLSKSKEKEVWQEATKVLQSRKDIQGKMMISYEALSEDEKEMFLDVACFLIGERESFAKYFWGGLNYASRSGLNRLKELCLVKVNDHEYDLDEDGDEYEYDIDHEDGAVYEYEDEYECDYDGDEYVKRLRMHDLLRDLGRSIVRDASKQTGKWSRLWDDGDLSKVLRTKQGLDQIRGIATSKKLNAGLLSQMHSLQLLFLNGSASLDGDCEGQKAEIKWLKCTEIDLVDQYFELGSLEVLDIGFNSTTGLQMLGSRTKLPSSFRQLTRLRILRMECC